MVEFGSIFIQEIRGFVKCIFEYECIIIAFDKLEFLYFDISIRL